MKSRYSSFMACGIAAMFLGSCSSPLGNVDAVDNTALKSITVSNTEMEPSMQAGKLVYEVYSGAESVSVKAEASDPGATVEIDAPESITLGDGATDVKIKVTSANRKSEQSYCIRIYRSRAKATLRTLDSVNGSLVPAKNLTYRIYRFGHLVGYLKPSANPQTVYLIQDVSFRIEAQAAGRAESAMEDVIAGAEGNDYSFYCQPKELSSFPASAPAVTAVQVTTAENPRNAADSEWSDLRYGDDLNLASVTGLKVTATANCEMDATSWSGTGMKLDFDNMPTVFNGLVPLATERSYDARKGLFTAASVFDVSGTQILPGAHEIDIVVYDRVNNRTEKILPVKVVSVPAEAQDISGAVYSAIASDMRTYGVSRGYFSVSGSSSAPASPAGTSYRISLSFKLKDAAGAALPILGFRLMRSEDGGNSWTQKGIVNYGSLSAGNAGSHSIFGVSSDWEIAKPYKCKIAAFSDSVHTVESGIFDVTLLPAFTASLVAPSHRKQAVPFDAASQTGPDLSFSLSNPAAWNPAVSDYFYFAPAVKDKTGQYAFYGEFRYAFASGSLQFKYGSGFYDVAANFGGTIGDYLTFENGTVTLKSSLLFLGYANMWNGNPIRLDSGITYEWDIFGSYNPSAGNLGSPSAMTPGYFQKSAAGCLSRSYADAYQNGNQTLNGWFEFTVQ